MAVWAPRMGALMGGEEKIGGGRRKRRNLGVVSLPNRHHQAFGLQYI